MNKYALGGALILLLAAFGGGYYMGQGQVRVETQERVVYKEGETRTVDHLVTVTKTVHPDGTITIIRAEEDKTVDKKTKLAEKNKTTVTTPALSQYRLGLGLHELRSTGDLQDWTHAYISGSRRVLGPIWGDVSIGLDKSITLGVSYEF